MEDIINNLQYKEGKINNIQGCSLFAYLLAGLPKITTIKQFI